jgi:transposase
MINMSQVNLIKELSRVGYPISEIAKTVKADEKTVRKYISLEDYSPKPPIMTEKPSILDPYKATIDTWLEEDKQSWYKQRHTAQRIHDRLNTEVPGYSCSYETVQRYVRKARQSDREQRANQELVWHPGEAQVDFGEADFMERDHLARKKYLVVSFPYSNDSFVQIFGGETAECVCQGLIDIFQYIGGVPQLLVFDNATGVGRRVGEVVREAELFMRFRAHDNFSIRFCNPNSGHEKGHVETKVRYNRSNLFVPIPAYEEIVAYNQNLLTQHGIKAKENHYKKLLPIHQLFEEDRAALLPLPRLPFNACRYLHVKADGYGKVRLDERHYYSSCPEYGGKEVLVAVRAHTIDILDDDRRILTVHDRKFGEQRSDSCDYRTSLAILLRNVGAWSNSGVRELMPVALRNVMDNQPRLHLQETVRTLQHLTKTYSFETAVTALEEGLRLNRIHFCDAAILAARISGYGLDTIPASGPDLSCYDELLQRRNLSC